MELLQISAMLVEVEGGSSIGKQNTILGISATELFDILRDLVPAFDKSIQMFLIVSSVHFIVKTARITVSFPVCILVNLLVFYQRRIFE